MARGTAVRSRSNPPRTQQDVRTLKFGPIIGLRDSPDPEVSKDPQRATVIENLYPAERDKPSVFLGRPGSRQAGAQLGATNKRTGQIVYQFTKLDGTEITLAVVGGQGIYTYDWSTDTWTQVVTVANLTTASITLSETARCFGLTYTDKLFFSDGTNAPFLWDGTSGAGGLTVVSNCPVLYGQPTIYYAKVFGIKKTDRKRAVWSEENDATIGYEMAAYLNRWDLTQTDQEGLVLLVGTNERLYYFRRDSTGAISGAVTPDFRNDGTREGVDETVGTLSPACAIYSDQRIFFPDARGRPHFAAQGAGAKGMWADISEFISTLDLSAEALEKAIGFYDPGTQLVCMGLVELGQSNPSCILVINPVLDLPVAVWRGFTFTAMAVVKNGDGDPVLMRLSEDGYAYYHGLPNGDIWSDELNEGTAAIRHTVETCHLGVSVRDEKRFTRTDIAFRADGEATSIGVVCSTPYGSSPSLSGSVEGASDRWDEDDWDEAFWGGPSVEQHTAFGLNDLGRWGKIRVSHEAEDEQFGFAGLSLQYRPAGDPMAAR